MTIGAGLLGPQTVGQVSRRPPNTPCITRSCLFALWCPHVAARAKDLQHWRDPPAGGDLASTLRLAT